MKLIGPKVTNSMMKISLDPKNSRPGAPTKMFTTVLAGARSGD
jgi:hypothetical protein